MEITVRKLHPLFAAEVTGIDLRRAESADLLVIIRARMDEHSVLVFPDQTLADQLAFAQRFDGALRSKAGISASSSIVMSGGSAIE